MVAKTRTPLFVQRTVGGAFNVVNIEQHPNNVWFVDANHAAVGSTEGYGHHPDKPLASLALAYSLDILEAGDVVYAMPGHAENLAAADAIAADIAGITVIGIGSGTLIPTLTATVAAGEIEVSAANIKFKHLRLTAGFTGGCTAAFDIAAGGDGFELEDIQFRDTSATKEWLIHVKIATTVTDGKIHKCSMNGLIGGDMTNSILFAGSSTDVVIEGNDFYVDSSDDVIDHLAAAGVNLQVTRNRIYNADAAVAGYCFRAHSSTTGFVTDNRFGYDKVDAEMGLAAGMFWAENYATNTIAQSGLLDPVTSHAIP